MMRGGFARWIVGRRCGRARFYERDGREGDAADAGDLCCESESLMSCFVLGHGRDTSQRMCPTEFRMVE